MSSYADPTRHDVTGALVSFFSFFFAFLSNKSRFALDERVRAREHRTRASAENTPESDFLLISYFTTSRGKYTRPNISRTTRHAPAANAANPFQKHMQYEKSKRLPRKVKTRVPTFHCRTIYSYHLAVIERNIIRPLRPIVFAVLTSLFHFLFFFILTVTHTVKTLRYSR